jgi:ketosteroid isomerase-like protein
MDLFSDSAEVIMPGMPAKIGKAQYDQVRQGFDSAFPDARTPLVSIIESGDTAAGEIVFIGTNTGSMASPAGGQIPPTGKKVNLPGAFVMKVKDGKITSYHLYFDQASMAQQLSMDPRSQR